MAVKGAKEVFTQARVTPDEVDVVELHDCFSTNELITYEALVHTYDMYMYNLYMCCTPMAIGFIYMYRIEYDMHT